MKRTIVIVVVAVIAVAIGWWAYSTYFAPPPEETDAEREAAAALAEMASGIWPPANWSLCCGPTSVQATAGPWPTYPWQRAIAEAGALLLELDNAVLQSEAQMAAAQVNEAQARWISC